MVVQPCDFMEKYSVPGALLRPAIPRQHLAKCQPNVLGLDKAILPFKLHGIGNT